MQSRLTLLSVTVLGLVLAARLWAQPLLMRLREKLPENFWGIGWVSIRWTEVTRAVASYN